MRSLPVLAFCALCASVAANGFTCTPYDGPDAVRQGEGGTSISKYAIDFWTRGTPPHRYKIVGTCDDKRISGSPAGSVVGDHAIANKTVELGGNSVIIVSQETKIVGYQSDQYSSYQPGTNPSGQSSFASMPIKKIETKLVIVRYIDPVAVNPALAQSKALPADEKSGDLRNPQ